MTYQRVDGTPLEELIAIGATGVVVRHNNYLVSKLPRIYKDPKATPKQAELYDIAAHQSLRAIEHEKNVLKRLGKHPGLVEWVDLSGAGIQMKYMMGGSLANYLRSAVPTPSIVRNWVFDIADAICYAHQQHVIIGDIASRNVLLDEHLKAKVCDFADSGLISPSTSITLAVDNGASVQTDIFQFGSLVFEIVSRKRFDYNLFDNEEVDKQLPSSDGYWEPRPEWPAVDALPTTEHLRFGSILRKCWTRAYAEMTEVREDLGREVLQSELRVGS